MARPRSRAVAIGHHPELSRRRVAAALAVLIVLIFSKYFYVASLTNYYTFYLMDTFGVSVQSAQIHLFVFLGAYAVGTVAGGPIGDRVGRKYVIWVSILGVLPFTLLLPHANLFWTEMLSIVIALVLSSAFAAILVYAQELMPGRVGMVAGMMPGTTASQVPAAAMAPVAAQPTEDKASAKVAMRDEVWRRRKWLRLAWVRNQSWMAVAEAVAARIPTAETRAAKGAANASATTKGAKTRAMAPITASIFARRT